ncbi:hypothetical protein [Streptomyces rimosus]|uniref:hypothetical protein n=1 Tax=Streptomyces rimosus TaxID=1927 RepID=UPI0004BE62D5|nr:hypothetical protein [Streptomyces rimosus]
MDQARLADRINRLPYEQWLPADESAGIIGVSAPEAAKLLRAGRRHGMLTVRRVDDGRLLFMRIRRRPTTRIIRTGVSA